MFRRCDHTARPRPHSHPARQRRPRLRRHRRSLHPLPPRAAPTPPEADGLTLTVSLDCAVVAPGKVVTFTATLTKTKRRNRSPFCSILRRRSLLRRLCRPPASGGEDVVRLRTKFKDYVLTKGYGPMDAPPTQPVRVEAVAEPCAHDEGHFEAIFAPGSRSRVRCPGRLRSSPVSNNSLAGSHSRCQPVMTARTIRPPAAIARRDFRPAGPDLQATCC